jgi:glycosyltransferase involved in cell wall biosynthesis
MRILFNGTAALAGTSGPAYLVEVISRIASTHADCDCIVLTLPRQAELRAALGARATHLVASRLPGSGLARTAALQWRLPALVRESRADVLFNKGNFFALRSPCPQVCLIENATPFSTLKLAKTSSDRLRDRLLRLLSDLALRRADAVIFPSETARRLISARSTVHTRTFVVPHGTETATPEAAPAAPVDPYLLCVSSLHPHKNVALALAALRQLHDRRSFTGRLLIVGNPGPSVYRRRLDQQAAALRIQQQVQVMPPVSREALARYYRDAECLLMPSLEETFGIPLVEAMALGTPVVAATAPPGASDHYFLPFEEICGRAAEYFEVHDSAGCASAIERAFTEPRRSEMKADGLCRAARYSWAQTAESTLRVLRLAVTSSRQSGRPGTAGG